MKWWLGRQKRLRESLRRFRDDEGGNVAIIMGLTIVVLMLSIGAAVDVGRWLHARNQTLSAIDAAVLAGGRTLQLTGDKDAAVDAATNYYNENVKSRLPVMNDTIAFTVADNGLGLSASGNAYIDTPFLQFATVDKLPLISLAQTKFGSQLGMKAGQTEISMMLDVTGSMCMPCTKLADLKTSAQKLVDIVTQANQNQEDKTTIAIVPFSEDIRLPSSSVYAAATGNPPKVLMVKSGSTQTLYNRAESCVVERMTSDRYTDTEPSADNYVMPHREEVAAISTSDGTVVIDGKSSARTGEVVTISWKRNTKLSTSQKNALLAAANSYADCTVPSSGTVQPLTSDTTVLSNKISNLTATGGTAGHLGTAWAWYTLSPEWNTLWESENQARDYSSGTGKNSVKKVAILMTDGDYNTQYDDNGVLANYGYTSSCPQAANGCSAKQALELCENMKAKGVEVWTVGFDVSKSSLAAQTLKACATDETKYYNAEDGLQLQSAFTDIAVKLTTVYLSK
ncbi:VWA domain-containing protein [Hyphomicrobium sp. 1Nfss2.1]|uniref:TadE/TadG family type IV pilus assembly protein n=1 Tax=Hyphomicrobium sp. 1Nfss2.1 TaxID=3413936 RepID=UPI003C7B04E4